MAGRLVSCILSHFPKVAEKLHSQFLTQSIALFFWTENAVVSQGTTWSVIDTTVIPPKSNGQRTDRGRQRKGRKKNKVTQNF